MSGASQDELVPADSVRVDPETSVISAPVSARKPAAAASAEAPDAAESTGEPALPNAPAVAEVPAASEAQATSAAPSVPEAPTASETPAEPETKHAHGGSARDWIRGLAGSKLARALRGEEDVMVAHAVSEGSLIVLFGVRMTVKNKLIVRAVGDEKDYSVEWLDLAVRKEISKAAREQRANSDMVRKQRMSARRRRGVALHEHDYRSEDVSVLDQRDAVYTAIADDLDSILASDELITQLVSKAREDAWNDISRTIEQRLDLLAAVHKRDEHYLQERKARMRTLREVDLARLDKARSNRKKRLRFGD